MIKKSIVSICWYKVFPAQNGGQKGIADFVTALAQQHKVRFLCSQNNHAAADFVQPILPTQKWQIFNLFNFNRIEKIIKQAEAEYIIIEHPYYALLFYYLKKGDKKYIVHSHNIEYQRLKNIGRCYWPIVKWLEQLAYKKTDSIWCKTTADQHEIVKWCGVPIAKIQIVPYGIDSALYANKNNFYTKEAADEKILLFAASFDYKPNVLALHHLINDVLPKLPTEFKYKIWVCGTYTDLLKVQQDDIVIKGFVNDLATVYHQADVVINPVKLNAGVQTKTVEALAYHKNVVCYANMINGLPQYLVNEKLFLANDSETFAQQIVAATLTNVATDARFFDEYNWDNIVKRLF